MHSYRIVWEDEAKAREIELLVHYRLDAGVVTVDQVRPVQVTLYNSSTKQPSRSVPVHTATGRRLLAAGADRLPALRVRRALYWGEDRLSDAALAARLAAAAQG